MKTNYEKKTEITIFWSLLTFADTFGIVTNLKKKLQTRILLIN